MRHGVEITNSGSTFRVWAPRHRSLSLLLNGRAFPMSSEGQGLFSFFSPEATEGARYAYQFEDGRIRPDPASLRQPEGVHGASALFDAKGFLWREEGWKGIDLESLVFYELHLGTFTEEGTLDAAAARLPELSELGVTCVELMPVQPFAGDRNWGYDGVLPYAVHESYGGPAALQRFVDAAHRAKLAVCLDVVFNHFGPEGNYLGEFAPYFSSRHRTPWGDGINYDGEGSGGVREFVIGAAVQWVRDFRLDALRLDAVHAIPDESPRHIVREITDAVRAVAQQTGRKIHVVAESDLNDRRVVDPGPTGWGASSAWADDFHHAVHALLTGERSYYYADFGRREDLSKALESGWVYEGQFSPFRGRPHGTSTKGLAPWQFVFSLQNHDQVGNRPRGERLITLIPREAWPPLAAILVLGPGLPLLFMGEEYGETRPFLYFTSHSDPALAKAVSEGRKREFIAAGVGDVPDPQDPATFLASKLSHRRDGDHGVIRDVYQQLLRMRRRYQRCIAEEWPRVSWAGNVVSISRSEFSLKANLGPESALGLPPWGWRVEPPLTV
jgi:maltooligosyltrehalose trehalohydrolase